MKNANAARYNFFFTSEALRRQRKMFPTTLLELDLQFLSIISQ